MRNLHGSRGRFLLFKEDCNMSVDRKTNTTTTEGVANSDSVSSMGETSASASSMSTEPLGNSLVPAVGGSKTKEKPPRFRDDVSYTNWKKQLKMWTLVTGKGCLKVEDWLVSVGEHSN